MATLVLTTVGTLIGGPIGGAVGALLGQQVDQRLFAPKGRQGPRLGELAVQSSTYGQPIAKLFGTLRVAGTVIWATDLIEDRQKSGGGKGKPKTTTYSYSANFAVALSARPIRAVHRIWADGKLLRGTAGDWKSETGFRLYLGDEDQAVDPLIAAIEGIGNAPAYRGLAYAVFEGLQLADYGNHIPSLTFEVEADAGPVTIAGIAAELSDGATGGATAAALGGYAASGDSVRGAIEALAGAATLSVRDDGAQLVLADAAGAPIAIAAEELGASADGKRREKRAIERRAAGALPDEVAIAYYEPERDYQAGLQRARREVPARRVERIDLPAAIPAGEAKAAAERRLATIRAGRARTTIGLPWRRMDLRPGDALTVPGVAGAQRVAGWTLERMRIELELSAIAASGVGAVATPGRGTGSADAPHGPTTLVLLDLPPIDESVTSAARVWIAAAGIEEGWRRAGLLASLDGGAGWEVIGETAAPATIGSAVGVLGAGDPAMIDLANAVEVDLLNDAMALAGRDDDALAAGANLAMLGDELVQFGSAEQTGPKRWRLSRLLRGRRGTEYACGGHVAGERFVLIEAAALAVPDLPSLGPGSVLRVTASGVGDASPAEAVITLAGRALRPPAPVKLTAVRLDDGTVRFGWTRRSRAGWAWRDGGDAPIGEESERYRLTITPAIGAPRTVEPGEPRFDYDPAAQAADGAGGATGFAVAVSQLGSIAPSLPAATASFTL